MVNRQLRQAEQKLEQLCAAIGETEGSPGEGLQRQDIMILKSIPGIGRINLAALVCEASGLLGSRDYRALRTLCGVAPVTRRSGKSHIVIMPYAAHVRLRNTVYHWARTATQHAAGTAASPAGVTGDGLVTVPARRGDAILVAI